MPTSPKKVEVKQKAAASRKLLFERYQRQYSFSNQQQTALPQVDENDDSTFACIHPSSPCRNLHHVPIADCHCLDDDDDEVTIFSGASEENVRRLSPTARARERQLALQQNKLTKHQPKRFALLVVDLQNDFLDESGLLGPSDMTMQRTSLLTRIRELTQQTLQLGGVVYFIQSVYFTNHDGGCCTMGTPGSDWHPEAAAMIELLSRHSRVHILTKQWYSAFLETTLHAQLQQQNVTDILVAGVSTPHSVAATVRSANHLGYVTTLTDATAQPDAAQQPSTYFSLAPFCHGVLAPSAPIQGQHYSVDVKAKDSDDEKKEDEEVHKKTRLNKYTTKPDRLVFDGCVRLSGIGAGDAMLLPEVFETEKADALLSVIVKVVGAKQKLHYEWTDDKTSTWTAIFRPIQTHIEKLTNQSMDWGRVVLLKPTDSQEEKSVATNASSSTEGTMNLGFPRKKNASSAPGERLIIESFATAAHELRDVYNQCYLPSDKITRRLNYVAVVALGEGRVIEFEPKNAEEIKYAPQYIYCHHNSLLLIGPRTLQNYRHIIKMRNRSNQSPRVHITLGGLSRTHNPVLSVRSATQSPIAVKSEPLLSLEAVPIDVLVVLRDNRLRKVISLIFFFGFLLGYHRATISPATTCAP